MLRSHRWRTAENSAAYLLPHLASGDRLLDVGCGPGTITVDLAARVAPGEVVGIDVADEVVAEAVRAAEEAGCANVTFARGDAYGIEAAAGSFDVVHAHQVLQHLGDPIAALTEMRRVLRPGGLLAVRDSDYGAFVWAPARRAARPLDAAVPPGHRAQRRPGRRRALATGLGERRRVHGPPGLQLDVDVRRSCRAASWWGQLWADRVRHSSFATQAKEYGLSDDAELADIADAFESWAAEPDGVFVVVHVEVLARTPA